MLNETKNKRFSNLYGRQNIGAFLNYEIIHVRYIFVRSVFKKFKTIALLNATFNVNYKLTP